MLWTLFGHMGFELYMLSVDRIRLQKTQMLEGKERTIRITPLDVSHFVRAMQQDLSLRNASILAPQGRSMEDVTKQPLCVIVCLNA